jgi:hypothetical protein
MRGQRDPAGQDTTPSGLDREKGATLKSTARSGRDGKKLQRNPEKKRTYSFSPGRHDTIRVPKDIHQTHPVPPIPPNVASKTDGGQNGEQEWRRVPTLHKRSAQDLPRRKSSKKRKEEHDRETEIKAMSATMPMPTRAATEYGLVGRPMKRDTTKARAGLSRNLTNPVSSVSLPTAESLHSADSGSEQYTSYKLKGIDLFSPRPTIRYAENPRYAVSRGINSSGSGSRRLPDREHISEELLNANNRIDDLADDLDAGSLRELMERDQRRRERKKIADQKRTERKLARNAERQRLAEAEAAKNGTPPPQNMERGVIGRELVGLGIEGSPPSSKRKASDASSKKRGVIGQEPVGLGIEGSPPSSKRKASDASPRRQVKDLAEVDPQASPTSVQNPFIDFQRSDSLPPTEPGSPVDEGEDLEIGTAKVARLSRASMSPPSSPKGHARGASHISEMIDLTKAGTRVEKAEPKKESLDLGSRQHQSWTSFFRRSTKAKRNSTPTSFSNTVRDSTSPTSQAPASSFTHAPRSSVSSSVPKRTMSRFREDLPELPLSPPDSRVQSPEADVVPPIRTGYSDKKGGGRGSIENPFAETSIRRHDTPTSGYRSLEQASRLRNETPTSGHRSDVPSPEPSAIMSQSLASIDSEGSWLSGRPRAGSKRSSAQQASHQARDSVSSLQKRYKEYSESAEELGIAEDEYFSRLTPGPEHALGKMSKRRTSGNPMPSSDEEDGDSVASPEDSTKWGAVGRQPTVVHHEPRAKSREGLLNDFENESPSDPPGDTPQELVDRNSYGFDGKNKPLPEGPGIERASSVNLGKGHARRISAGSARLLDLKPRKSMDARTSIEARRASTSLIDDA